MRALIPLALTLATPALADEVWSTPFGDAIYEADVGDTTILTVPQQGGIMRVYIPGLAGNFDNRGTHAGYWIGTGEGYCPAGLTGIDGTGSRQWGEVILAFDRPAFPTRLDSRPRRLLRAAVLDRPRRSPHRRVGGRANGGGGREERLSPAAPIG